MSIAVHMMIMFNERRAFDLRGTQPKTVKFSLKRVVKYSSNELPMLPVLSFFCALHVYMYNFGQYQIGLVSMLPVLPLLFHLLTKLSLSLVIL